MKYSKQRELIENFIKETKTHPTADEVYFLLKSVIPNLSLGTVYRNLNCLADSGKILRLLMQDGKSRFDGDIIEHSHIVCNVCGKVYDINIPEMLEIDKIVNKKTGINITSHQVIFNGICNECK